MCKDGINAEQLNSTIEQIDEAVALCRRWTHRVYHQVEEDNMLRTAAKMRDAQALLDDIRALLEEASELVLKESADDVTVQVV
ncbi:MAG: dynein gamma chain protein [Coriobacteriia bacterium]|nr:dynein gamma chain protein [Coriobacteriia bacterium]